MRYSIQDEDLSIIRNIENDVSESIQQIYNEYVENITEWGKRFNSELVYQICKKTIGMIDEDYIQAMNNFVPQFDEISISFVSISKRYKVGDNALDKVERFQNEILEKAISHNANEIQFVCDGDARYSNELINEYKEINQEFLSKLEDSYDENYFNAKNVSNSNLLGDGVDALIKYQYETIQKICMLYDTIFEMFLGWYERTLRENEALLESLNQQMRTTSFEIGNDEIEKLLIQIMDDNIGGTQSSLGANSSLPGGSDTSSEEKSEEKKQETIKDAAHKAVMSSVDSLLKELDTPEKIQNFKQYVGECQRQYEECNQEQNKEVKKGKFQKICDFIKKGAKKYGKPIMKTLGIVVPLIAPEGHIVAKIAKSLPAVMECFTGATAKESDADKIELGLECMKTIGVDKLPENENEVKHYFDENGEAIAKDILTRILSSKKYMNVLGIDDEELSRPENQKLYKAATGKDVNVVPQKRKTIDHDFEQYDPKKLKSITPIESEEKAKKIVGDISAIIPNSFDNSSYENISRDLGDVKKQVETGKGCVQLDNNEELRKLIEELRRIVNGQLKGEVLQNIDGRYNKEDMRMLCDEFEYEKGMANKSAQTPNINRACQNFIRRQMGYPAEYDKPTIKETNELIPLINKKCGYFSIENNELVSRINDAQNFFKSKNGNLKKKSVLNSIAQNTIGIGAYLGLGASMLMASFWPLGIVLAAAPLCVCFTDIGATAYASLVSQLGEERVDTLLNNYQNVDGGCYQFSKESVNFLVSGE